MTTRRDFIEILAGSVIASLSDANAQQPGKVWRISFLSGGARTPDGAPPAALRQALQELGYLDGTGINYVGRWAEAKSDRLPRLAAELEGLKVDLIVTLGGAAAGRRSLQRSYTSSKRMVLISRNTLVRPKVHLLSRRPTLNRTFHVLPGPDIPYVTNTLCYDPYTIASEPSTTLH